MRFTVWLPRVPMDNRATWPWGHTLYSGGGRPPHYVMSPTRLACVAMTITSFFCSRLAEPQSRVLTSMVTLPTVAAKHLPFAVAASESSTAYWYGICHITSCITQSRVTLWPRGEPGTPEIVTLLILTALLIPPPPSLPRPPLPRPPPRGPARVLHGAQQGRAGGGVRGQDGGQRCLHVLREKAGKVEQGGQVSMHSEVHVYTVDPHLSDPDGTEPRPDR